MSLLLAGVKFFELNIANKKKKYYERVAKRPKKHFGVPIDVKSAQNVRVDTKNISMN